MRKSVVDSSTLISLAKIGLLSILMKLGRKVLAPSIVRDETIVEGVSYPESNDINELFEKNVIITVNVARESRDNVAVQYGLKEEDAEVLALAIKEKADEVLVNDVKLSRRAEAIGFEIASAFDLLYEALLAGVLDYSRYNKAFDTLVSEGEISLEAALFYKLKGLEVKNEKG